MKILNKVIVITGASRGFGREIAIRLSKKNPDLILVARSKKSLEEVQKKIENLNGIKPLIISCDISNEMEVNQMAKNIYEKYNKVDVLINNAGMGIHKIFEELSCDDMRKQFDVNFNGPFYCIKFLLSLIKRSNCGYILNISSLVSKVSYAENSVYASTKAALSSFTEGLYYELKKSNIKTGLFLPGLMNTTFFDDVNEGFKKIPSFLVLDPKKAALKLEKMINKRKRKVYMYRWMLFFMKLKRLF